MGLLRYITSPVRSIAKNRMRTLYAVIGVILAISFFSGSFIAVDSSTMSLVRSRMDEVAVDYSAYDSGYGYQTTFDITDATDTATILESVDDVKEVVPMALISDWTVTNPNASQGSDDYYSYYYSGTVAFLYPGSAKLLDAYGIDGTVPAEGTIAISKSKADNLGVGVGSYVNLTHRFSTYDYVNGSSVFNVTFVNLTFKVSQVWTQEGYYPSYYYYTALAGTGGAGSPASVLNDDVYIDNNNPVFLNVSDIDRVIAAEETVESYVMPSVRYSVWIDRDKVVSPGDLSGTLARLQVIKNRLDLKGQTLGGITFTDNLGQALSGLNSNMEGYKLFFFALSMPVMLLGTYISVVGIDLATSERRREIGIKKARGAKDRQIIGEMAMESLILGAIAGAFGLLGGIALSRALLNVSTAFLGSEVGTTRITDFAVDTGTVLTTIFIGVLLMMVASYRPVKRLVKTEVAEALHFFVPAEARKDYHMKWDIAALILSGLSIFCVIALTQRWFSNLGGSFVFAIVFLIIIVIGVAMLPLLPLLLSVSIIRLLTRGPKKIYKKVAALLKPWTRDVHYLIEVNIERNPKRSSMLCMIIALAVAFGLFVSVTMESTLAYEIDRVRYDIGADVQGVGYLGESYYTSSEPNIAALDALDSSPNIESICRFFEVPSNYGIGYYGWSFLLVDVQNYIDIVHPADFWFVGNGSDVLEKVDSSGGALIMQAYAEMYSIRVGDVIPMSAEFTRENQTNLIVYFNVTIVGIVNNLPGLPGTHLLADRSVLAQASDENLVNTTSGSTTFGVLVEVKGGSNHADVALEVKKAIENTGAYWITVRDRDAVVQEVYQTPGYGALAQFFNTEYAISMVMMTVGVAIIIFVTVGERRQEIACIMARGSSGPQMGKILMGESITLMILGLVVGTSVGLVTAYLYNYLSAGLSYQVGHPLVVTFVSAAILVVAVVSMLVASFLTTVRAGKIRLAEILRVRGG